MNDPVVMSWIWVIVIGILAGFLAGKIMRGKGYGMIVDLLLGIVGAVLGGYIFGLLGVGGGRLVWRLLTSLVGALIILFVIRLIKKD
jgi:uncharacterized membrane protein YeaQ/YmgE (transglycosylase-associated protein family)